MADRARPGEQLTLPEDRRDDRGVVLVEPATDPRIVGEEHVALVDAGAVAAVLENPVDREIHRRDEARVVEAHLNRLAQLVADRDVHVVRLGHRVGARHPLERLPHLLGDRPHPVPKHLVGERVDLGLIGGQLVEGQLGRDTALQLIHRHRAALELAEPRIGRRVGGAHWAVLSDRSTRMLPNSSTRASRSAGMVTVVVATSMTAGPGKRCPLRNFA